LSLKATLICSEEYKIEKDELSHPIKKNKVLEACKEEKNVKKEMKYWRRRCQKRKKRC